MSQADFEPVEAVGESAVWEQVGDKAAQQPASTRESRRSRFRRQVRDELPAPLRDFFDVEDDSAATDRGEVLPLVSDAPIDSDAADRLGFGPYADAIYELIDNPDTTTPLTIAVSATWGSGKSSLATLIKQRLRNSAQRIGDQEPHLVASFNAWQHQHAEIPATALSGAVASELIRHQPFWRLIPLAVFSPLAPRRWKLSARIGLLATVLGVVVYLLATGQVPDFDEEAWTVAGASLAALATIATIVGHTSEVMRFVSKPREVATTGSIGAVGRRLGSMVRYATRRNRRFVVFIDDLDRLPPETALAFVETTQLLLAHDGVVVVLLVDGQALEMLAVDDDADARDRSRQVEYMRKFVQVTFDIPPTPADRKRALLTEPPPERRDTDPSPSSTNDRLPPPIAPQSRQDDAATASARDIFRLARWRHDDLGGSAWVLLGRAIAIVPAGLILIALAALIPVVGVAIAGVLLVVAGLAASVYLGAGLYGLALDAALLYRLRKLSDRLPARVADLLADGTARSVLGERAAERLADQTALPTVAEQQEIRSTSSDYVARGFGELLAEPGADIARHCVDRATPRDLVRVQNRLRLIHAVALRRGLISPGAEQEPPFDAATTAKWCTILEFGLPDARRALFAGTLPTGDEESNLRPGRLDGPLLQRCLEEDPALDADTIERLIRLS